MEKVVILAGGLGTRLAEHTDLRPKPMVEIGGRPILWHIMKGYAEQGFREFVIAAGYKSEVIKRFFLDYHALGGNVTVRLRSGESVVERGELEDWTVHILDTGLETMTGGRLRRLAPLLGERFLLTYGDGVCDVDLKKLLAFHAEHGRLATVTAVRPPARFGALSFDGPLVRRFVEKPTGETWINGGFMVIEPAVLESISGDATVLEADVLEKLAGEGQLAAYRHEGFWQCMDTVRDLKHLEGLWAGGRAPWRTWRDRP